jgi:phage terminase large subunit-like protein
MNRTSGKTRSPATDGPEDPPPFNRDWAGEAIAFAREIVSPEAAARHGKFEKLAAARMLRDLERAKSPDCPFYLDAWEAGNPCDFAEKLPHIEGEWPTPTIRLEPAQVFVLVNVFGWRQRAFPKRRRFNTIYLEVARKNAKSTLSAIVALYCLTCEGERGPQIKCAATTGAQARIVFNLIREMVNRTPDVRDEFNLETFARTIACYENAGNVQPINAKASTQDGLNPHAAIIDELHAHKTRELFDVLRSARGARKNPLSWYVTTAGYVLEGVCYEQRKLLAKILEGLFDADHYFGVIYTIDDGDDIFDEAVWQKANPLINVLDVNELRQYATEARVSPESEREFKTKRLNVWTAAKGGWITLEKWLKCNGPANLEDARRLGIPVYMGLDLASVVDMTASGFAWRQDGRIKVAARYYVPEAMVLERKRRESAPYAEWIAEGWIVQTPGDVCDYPFVEADLEAQTSGLKVEEIAFDKWNAQEVSQRMIDKGAPMLEFIQGPRSYHPGMQALERAYLSGILDHGGNPVLNWNASNIVKREDVNKNGAPDRKRSQDKIDGLCAVLMALARMIAASGGSLDDFLNNPISG